MPGVVVKKDGNVIDDRELFYNTSISIELEGFDATQDGYTSGVNEIWYSLEEHGASADFQLYTGAVLITELNKKYDLQYYAVDFAGNSSVLQSKTIVLENILPVAGISVVDGFKKDSNYYISSNSAVSVYGFDTGFPVSGIAGKEYIINGISTDWENYTLPLHPGGEGLLDFQARVIDRAGNVSTIVQENFIRDNIPPLLSIENIYMSDGMYIISSQQLIEFLTQDVGSGIESVYWIYQNKKYIYNEPFRLNDVEDFSSLKNEDYLLFHLYTHDNVKNTASILMPIEIDDLAPEISIFNLSDGDKLNNNVMLRGRIFDKFLKEYTIWISPDTDPVQYTLMDTGNANVDNEDFYLLDIEQYKPGNYILKIEAVD